MDQNVKTNTLGHNTVPGKANSTLKPRIPLNAPPFLLSSLKVPPLLPSSLKVPHTNRGETILQANHIRSWNFTIVNHLRQRHTGYKPMEVINFLDRVLAKRHHIQYVDEVAVIHDRPIISNLNLPSERLFFWQPIAAGLPHGALTRGTKEWDESRKSRMAQHPAWSRSVREDKLYQYIHIIN